VQNEVQHESRRRGDGEVTTMAKGARQRNGETGKSSAPMQSYAEFERRYCPGGAAEAKGAREQTQPGLAASTSDELAASIQETYLAERAKLAKKAAA